MQPFFIRWLCTTAAVTAAVYLTGMKTDGWTPLLGTALLLGIFNALVRPILLMLSLPFIVVTMGLFILIINAAMLSLAGGIVPGFYVGGFWNAFFGSIIVSLVSGALSIFFRTSDGKVHVITHHPELKPVRGRVVERLGGTE